MVTTACIADTDRIDIVSACVRANTVQGASLMDRTVDVYEIMVSYFVKAALAVP